MKLPQMLLLLLRLLLLLLLLLALPLLLLLLGTLPAASPSLYNSEGPAVTRAAASVAVAAAAAVCIGAAQQGGLNHHGGWHCLPRTPAVQCRVHAAVLHAARNKPGRSQNKVAKRHRRTSTSSVHGERHGADHMRDIGGQLQANS